MRAASRVESAMVHRRRDVTLARAVPGDYERIVTSAGEVARALEALRS
jgi:hypothetical protein